MRRVELVVWLDSWQEAAGWHTVRELRRDLDMRPRQRTVGYVIGESKRTLLIASSLNASGLASGVTAIPKVAIVRRRAVKPR